MFAAPGALADALVRDWNFLADNSAGRTLVWAFSPFHLIEETIRSIGDGNVDAILIVLAGYGSMGSPVADAANLGLQGNSL
jgi:hypothetical protein